MVRDLRPIATSSRQSQKKCFIFLAIGITLSVGIIVLVVYFNLNKNEEQDEYVWPTTTDWSNTQRPTWTIYTRFTTTSDAWSDSDYYDIEDDDTSTTTTTKRTTTTSTSTTTTTSSTTSTSTRSTTTTSVLETTTASAEIQNRTVDAENRTLSNETTPNSITSSTTEASTTTSLSQSEDYFAYALNHSSLINSTGKDDFSFGEYPIPGGFNVVNQAFYSFYINVDGKVTARSINGFHLRINPFDADIDTRVNGAILHAEIKRTDLMDSIGADVRRLCPGMSFNPTWAYAITWFECRPYFKYLGDSLYGSKSAHKNTFQLIMASDSVYGFAFYNFIQMDWPNRNIDTYFESGFSYMDRMFRTTRVVLENISKDNLVQKSNFNRPGRWFLSFNNSRCPF